MIVWEKLALVPPEPLKMANPVRVIWIHILRLDSSRKQEILNFYSYSIGTLLANVGAGRKSRQTSKGSGDHKEISIISFESVHLKPWEYGST